MSEWARIQFECGQLRVSPFPVGRYRKNRIYDNTIAWIVHRRPCQIFWPGGWSCLYASTHCNAPRLRETKTRGMLFTGRNVIFQSTERVEREKLATFLCRGKLPGRKQIKIRPEYQLGQTGFRYPVSVPAIALSRWPRFMLANTFTNVPPNSYS